MSLSSDQIEIVGFNGVVVSDCGRALAIARNRTSDRYFKLSEPNQLLTPQSTYTREEIEAHQKAGRLTLLPKPVCGPPASTVVYVTERFIRAFGFSNAGQLTHTLDWQRLDGKGVCWAASDAADAIEKQMDEWGKRLLAKADGLLAGLLELCASSSAN